VGPPPAENGRGRKGGRQRTVRTGSGPTECMGVVVVMGVVNHRMQQINMVGMRVVKAMQADGGGELMGFALSIKNRFETIVLNHVRYAACEDGPSEVICSQRE
jgi:hypothetical protein